MRSRDAVRTTLLAAALVTPSYSGSAGDQPGPCDPPRGAIYHGQLMQDLSTYSNDQFRVFAASRNWIRDKGVDAAPRRADCGEGCVYRGPANERDDSPKATVRISNHPICDAHTIAHLSLPEHGVLIGRLTHVREDPPGSPRMGDASFNVKRATPGSNPGRLPEHYVVVLPGRQFLDKQNYAIWKIVTILNRDVRPVSVVDSGLFRVCLPKHPAATDTLASFRSCAEVSEFHELSQMRGVQMRLVGEQFDSTEAQRRVFSMLVRADTTALARLSLMIDSIRAAPRPAPRREGDAGPETMTHGPFAGALHEGWTFRRLERYGELHVDAPLWYTCAQGCCSGEPW